MEKLLFSFTTPLFTCSSCVEFIPFFKVVGYFETEDCDEYRNFQVSADELVESCVFFAAVGDIAKPEMKNGPNVLFKNKIKNRVDRPFYGQLANQEVFKRVRTFKNLQSKIALFEFTSIYMFRTRLHSLCICKLFLSGRTKTVSRWYGKSTLTMQKRLQKKVSRS